MKAKWTLLAATVVLAVGCEFPKVKKFEYKPPELQKPTFSELDRLLEDLREMDCEEKPGKVQLQGPIYSSDKHFDIEGDREFKWIKSKPMDAPGENGNSKLLNLGCSEDFVKKHNSEQLEVREFQSGDNLIASKVLLCGAQIDLPNLIVVAKTVILNDFFFLGGNESAIRVGAGTLILTGSNSIGKTTVNFDAAEEVNDSGISLVIQTALEGDGKLKLGSSFFTCKKKSEANETSAAARVSAE